MAGTALAHLSEKQGAFVSHMAQGLKQTDAARAAGYSDPGSEACRLLRAPSVAAALRQEINRKVAVEGRPKAFNTLMDLMEPSQPPATRLGAAKAMLEYEQKLAESLGLGKPIDDWSEAELASLAQALRPHEGAGMVDITPDVPKAEPVTDAEIG